MRSSGLVSTIVWEGVAACEDSSTEQGATGGTGLPVLPAAGKPGGGAAAAGGPAPLPPPAVAAAAPAEPPTPGVAASAADVPQEPLSPLLQELVNKRPQVT